MKNFHLIQAVLLKPTKTLGYRIKLTSHRFKHSLTIGYNHTTDDVATQVESWLKTRDFEILGKGEGLKGYYFICDTFKPLNDFI